MQTLQTEAKPRIVVQSRVNSYSRFEFLPPIEQDYGLLEQLRQSIPFLRSRPYSKRDVLRSHGNAQSQLATWKEQTLQFVQAMFDDAIELQHDKYEKTFPLRSKALQAARDLLTDFYHFRFEPQENAKSLSLLSRTASEIYKELRTHFEQTLETFVMELVALFNAMQDQGVVGSHQFVGEPGDRHCQFSFFRCRIVARFDGVTETRVEGANAGPVMRRPGETGWWVSKHITRRFLRSGTHTIQHVNFNHLLSHCVTTPVRSWRLPVPRRVASTLAVMPQFLFDRANITTGNLEHARIVARDVGQSPWQYTKVTEQVEVVRHYDPMLSIGPWVIAGWCPDEQPSATFLQRLSTSLPFRTSPKTFQQVLQLTKGETE